MSSAPSRSGAPLPRRLIAAVFAVMVALTVIAAASPGGAPAERSPAHSAGRSPAPKAFEVGVNAHPESDLAAVSRLGAKVVRMEFDIGTPVEAMRPAMSRLTANGARAVLLAGFHGRVPSDSQARSLRAWAREFGPGGAFWAGRPQRYEVRQIEFGNETSYQHQYGDSAGDASYASRARTIALRARTAALAVRGTGVGLLIQGDDGATNSDVWMKSMLSAVPELPSLAAGWTIHPYGPSWPGRLDRLVRQSAEAGAPPDLPLYVTEWGLSTDGGRCLSDNYGWNRCLNFADAAVDLRRSIDGMRARYGKRLRMVLLYQTYDQRRSGTSRDREHYFGLLRADARSPKGALTRAAKAALRR